MKLIKTLFCWMRKVKHMCSELKYGCDSCPFRAKQGTCKIKNLVYDLCKSPSDWNIDECERRWNE